MTIAFIGHSYHERTGSHGFFIELLKKLGTVETFYDESWRHEPSAWARVCDPARYDCVVIWQVTTAFRLFREPHPNVIFVPMYDAMVHEGNISWSSAYDQAKVLCFSAKLDRIAARHTARSRHFRYYPDPAKYPLVPFGNTLRGLFWHRVRTVNENVVARLSADTVFDRFTIRDAADPFSGARTLVESPIRSRHLKRSGWSRRREDYLAELAQHNVFFAPRATEGIGMSVLEAMAMGMCVVAPDLPTHNEYISHGANGILYDLTNVRPADFRAARELSMRARDSVEKGYERWSAAEDRLLSFLSLPTKLFDALSQRCSA